MMTGFTARPVDPNFMSLVRYCYGVSMRDLMSLHGAGRMEGHVDSRKGYDGDEIGFVHDATGFELYVYARWGEVRIGCRVHERPDAEAIAAQLAQFLLGPSVFQ